MKILLAGDEYPYSEFAVKEAIKLAKNTWADVTLLGVDADSSAKRLDTPADLKVAKVFQGYRELFLESWAGEESPYGSSEGAREWKSLQNGRWEEAGRLNGGRKDFKFRLRVGKPGAEILAEAEEDHSDIIVIGCAKGDKCVWEGAKPVPQQIVDAAECSALLVKQEQPVTQIRACLDQGHISQESLEMINQMVTIHSAKLELIGLSENQSIKVEAFSKLSQLSEYYSERDIDVSTRLTEISKFEEMISESQDDSLLAIWAGKRSLIQRFFPKNWIGSFVSKCRTSALVMR